MLIANIFMSNQHAKKIKHENQQFKKTKAQNYQVKSVIEPLRFIMTRHPQQAHLATIKKAGIPRL